ncbi:MAG: class I SAM-dependent methyltransferase [Gammaproteobacteria bacterium]
MDLPRLFRDPFRRLPADYREHLLNWFSSPPGESLLAAECRVLDDITPCIFGYHAAQVCAVKPVSLLGESRILTRVLVGTFEESGAGVNLLASPHRLPFASDSLDLLVLHHGLDFEDDPHQVLREAARAVIPGGALVVVGFNPWSLFGLLRLFRFGNRVAPWFARCISPHRVSDWLNVLDFRVDGLESGYHLPPLAGNSAARRPGWLDHLGARWWPQRGTFYVLVARKSVAPLIPVRRSLRQVRPIAVGVPVTGRVARRDDIN